MTRVVPVLASILAGGFAAGAAAWVALAPEEPLAPWAWPVLWGTAAVLVAAWLARPGVHALYRAAAATSVTAIAARPVGVAVRAANGAVSPARLAAGVIVYAVLAAFVWAFWAYAAGPLHERHRRPRGR